MILRRFWLAGAAAVSLLAAPITASADVQYVYDSAGRLIRATYSNGIVIDYRYDAAGNRRQIVTTQAPNTPPVAANDTAAAAGSATVDIQVLTNDTDPESQSLSVTSVGSVTGGGTVSIQGGGSFVRFVAPSTAGTKTFSYTISDGQGGTATATVSVTVTVAANVPPVAVNDSATTVRSTSNTILVLANDTDANGNTLTVTAVTTPTGGTVSIGPGGGYVIYNAPATLGTRTFNYTVSDGAGGTAVGTVTVQVVLGEEGCDPYSGQNCDN